MWFQHVKTKIPNSALAIQVWNYKSDRIQSPCVRTKIQEGDKAIGEVLDWYEEVNSQTLAYVTYSIHDSDISDFYREVGSNL